MADRTSTVARTGGGSSLADVLDRILDKGLVIDAWIRVSIVGLEILTVEARVVVASVDTYLRYADAISRTGLVSQPQEQPQLDFHEMPSEAPALPSDEDIHAFLQEHGEGFSLPKLAEHFGVPKDALEARLRELESKGMLESAPGPSREQA